MNKQTLLDKIKSLDETSTRAEIINLVTYDFKRLAPSENNHFKHWHYQENPLISWFHWRKQNQLIPNWMEQYAPDNIYSSPTLNALYQQLGWGNVRYTDTIDSFLTMYSFALYLFYPEEFAYDRIIHSIRVKENGQITRQIVSEKFLLGEAKKSTNTYRFEDFPKVNALVDLQELAKLTHTFGNFMPCPAPPYNMVKGTSAEIKDFLDVVFVRLMARETFTYQQDKQVSLKTINIWRDWFKLNSKRYLLEESDYQQLTQIDTFEKIEPVVYLDLIRAINKRIYQRGLKMMAEMTTSVAIKKMCADLLR